MVNELTGRTKRNRENFNLHLNELKDCYCPVVSNLTKTIESLVDPLSYLVDKSITKTHLFSRRPIFSSAWNKLTSGEDGPSIRFFQEPPQSALDDLANSINSSLRLDTLQIA